MIKSIRQQALNRQLVAGTFLNLGSSLTVEMAGQSGFDWVLIDIEHGSGDHESLVYQLQSISSTPAVPIVRIANNDPPRFKRVLDLGASGIMVPYVSSVEEAELAVASMRYPPRGIRGVAKLNRGSAFGSEFDEYFEKGHELLTTVVQIETAEAAKNAGKSAGILLLNPDQMPATVEAGFTFIALGSDGGLIAAGMRNIASAFEPYRGEQ
jgi:4-hydroxy-2-oxoheptanedioate aldolase